MTKQAHAFDGHKPIASITAMTVVSLILRTWLPTPPAMGLSVTIVLLTFSLFEPSDKRKLIVILLIGLSVYVFATGVELIARAVR